MSNFGFYTGKEFFNLKLEKRMFLVDNILREKDSVIFIGGEKSGKSLLMFQLICSLTSGHPFLDKHNVNKPCKVTYLQLEGELEDSQDRFCRLIRTLDFNNDMFQFAFLQPLDLQNYKDMLEIQSKIEKHQPDILIIDPLYFAFTGDLNDNKVVREFIGNLRILKENLNCAIILVHHTHRIRTNKDGKLINEGDDALFGSSFLRAWPDHLLMFSYNKKNETRTLSCTTQRSGDVLASTILKLIQPNPLYFEEADKEPTKESTIISLLGNPKYKEGLTINQIEKHSKLGRTTIYKSLKNPLVEGVIVKTDSKPVLYKTNCTVYTS